LRQDSARLSKSTGRHFDAELAVETASRWAVIKLRVPMDVKLAFRDAFAAKAKRFHINDRDPAVAAGQVVKKLLGLKEKR